MRFGVLAALVLAATVLAVTVLAVTVLAGCFDGGGAARDRGDPRTHHAPGTVPRLQVEPAALDFGRIHVGGTARRTLTVTNTGGGVLALEALRFDYVEGFEALIGDAPAAAALGDPDGDGRPGLVGGASARIDVVFRATAPEREIGALVIDTNAASEPRRTVSLVARATLPRCLEAAPEAVRLGPVPVGQAREVAVTLGACPDQQVVVQGTRLAEESDDAFDLVPLVPPVRVPPDQAVVVRFQPQARGDFTGALMVESDADTTPVVRIPLSGQGTANLCPEARVAAVRRPVLAGDLLVLDASPSVDADGVDGRPLAWHWRLLEQPFDAAATVVEAGGEPDDPRTPTAQVRLPTAGTYRFEVVVEDEQGLGPEDGPLCAAARETLTVEARRNPEPGLAVQLRWATPGLPDVRRPGGTMVDLHLRHPDAGAWFDPALDCHPARCAADWGEPGPFDDPVIRFPDNGPSFQSVEILAPEDTGRGAYRVGAHYRRAADPVDGYDFGPSWARLAVYRHGELVWDSATALGEGRRLGGEGAFWDAVEISLPGGEVRVVDRVLPPPP